MSQIRHKIGQELEALISLLDDPDNKVSIPVIDRLLQFGEPAVALLESKWKVTSNALKQERIENVIQQIQQEKNLKDIKDWADCRGEQLLFGAYLISRIQYPNLGIIEIESKVSKIRSQVWLELNNRLTAFEKIRVLNHFLFDIHDFSVSNRDMLSPYLYFINHALKTHRGQPVLLSVIYQEIAEQLELPVFGVNLPGQYLLCYQDKTYLNDENGIMFYINPAARGSILGKQDVIQFLKDQNIKYDESQLLPNTKIDMIKELLKGLQNVYKLTGVTDKAKITSQALSIVSNSKNEDYTL